MPFELDWKVVPPDPELSNTGKCEDARVPWSMGVLWNKPVRQPIRCALNPRRGPKLRDAYFIDIPLFSPRLLKAVQSIGVDNLQLFDCELVDLAGEVHSHYKAVNIIGAVKCADMAASEHRQVAGAAFIDFTKLVIDNRKVLGLDLFRLGERPGRIITSDRLATAILSIDPVGISLIPLESTG
jgi:hypothetical protein